MLLEELIGCFTRSGIQIIEDNIFEYGNNIKNVEDTFRYCKNLTTIPGDLFSSCSDITSFSYTFASSGLTSIPEGLFANNSKATNFDHTFDTTKITEIPDDLFANISSSNELILSSTFGSTGLERIPAGLFDNKKIANFERCFTRTQIEEVDNSIWGIDVTKDYITTIEGMFSYCPNLRRIEDGFFDGATSLKEAQHLFEECTSLEEVGKIFEDCVSLEDIGAMFYNCTSLVNVDEDLFNDCSIKKITYSVGSGSKPEYYYEGLFEFCGSLRVCPKVWEWTNLIDIEEFEDKFDKHQHANIDTFANSGIRSDGKGLDDDLIEWWWTGHTRYY